jgi:hypothetical protein
MLAIQIMLSVEHKNRVMAERDILDDIDVGDGIKNL